ncbi:MAG: hypothetical protein M3N46_06530 [Actinomycetota bacterium]|nr:hypothetical protein [Actinomycetota bacterium]
MTSSSKSFPIALAIGALVVAVLTVLVVLIRAGGDPSDAANWLVQWELRSSDNGPLFQFMQDLVAGRPLDWVFSPQVYVFPELPISALAFAVTGGNVYGYYLAVAVLNNALLYLALLGLVRVLFPLASSAESAVRAGIATVPLLLLPLVGTSWIFSFQLAPTYYFGMYLALISAPILLLTRSRGVRLTLAVALAVTAASNPLTLLFAAPGTAVALALLLLRQGWRIALRPGVGIAAVLAFSLGFRLLFLPLQGTSPFTYANPTVFAGRLSAILPYYQYQARDPAAAVILDLGVALSVVSLLAAAAAIIVFWRRRRDGRLLAVVYLGLVPLGGLAMTYAFMITHYLYFWPVLVLPLVLWPLALPRVALRAAGGIGVAAFMVIALATGIVAGNLTHLDRYFGYRNDETACIASAVPNGSVGYATFSDARRLSLTSAGRFRLLQLQADAKPHTWLMNRATVRTEAGTFFYLNGSGDETQIDPNVLRRTFGDPDVVARCSDTQSVWLYTAAPKLKRIAEFYRVH